MYNDNLGTINPPIIQLKGPSILTHTYSQVKRVQWVGVTVSFPHITVFTFCIITFE